jgi:dipeptidyl-peptidase-3
MLRYSLDGFQQLTLQQKRLVYCLAKATLYGRDITFDQNGKYNLLIRKTLETVYTDLSIDRETDAFRALEVYLKRLWFSNGIYHHYGCEKFVPGFSQEYFTGLVREMDDEDLPMDAETLLQKLVPVIFDTAVLPKRVNRVAGEDLVLTSACNYYEGVTQKEAEDYYEAKKRGCASHDLPSYGLNSLLRKAEDGRLVEDVWFLNGKYGKTIAKIIENLEKAREYAENDIQKEVIGLLTDYYTTGDLSTFDAYSIKWLQETEGRVDFINGFIEVYGDPLGYKASWEGIVE